MINLIKDLFFKKEHKPIGRHLLVLITKEMLLGEQVTVLEKQIAINKDKAEYEEILTEVDDIVNYIKSEHFKEDDLVSLDKNIRDTIKKGYSNYVLQTNSDLKEKCLKALHLINEYVFKKLRTSGVSENEIQKIQDLELHYEDLGFITSLDFGHEEGAEVQMGGNIIRSLFEDGNILISIIAILPQEDQQKYIKNLEKFLEKLSLEKRLSENEIRKVRDMINIGVNIK